MPIEFACACGKQFKVADGFAGKRSKCTACGQPVVVPPPPATVEESAEDAAMRALLDGDDPEPAPRTTSGYATRTEPTPPRSVPSASAVAPRPQASHSRKDPPPTYRPTTDAPPKRRSSPNWAKVIGGVVMAVLGFVVGVGALTIYFGGGSVQRWAFIVPVPFILASPFFIIDGFRDRSKK